MELRPYKWSHGYHQIVRDQSDTDHARRHAAILGGILARHRADYPDDRIVLIGHSAGCFVAAEAAVSLPPDTIDRVVLLAPSVTVCYDIRPALRASREGVDVFYSRRDHWVLGIGMRLLGPLDNPSDPRAAGRLGLWVRPCCPGDEVLLARLRQHGWGPDQKRQGHNGGHFATYTAEHLRRVVVPMLLGQR